MEKMPKNAEIFICKICDFKCCKQSNYDKHLATAKHQKLMFVNQKNAEDKIEKFIPLCLSQSAAKTAQQMIVFVT